MTAYDRVPLDVPSGAKAKNMAILHRCSRWKILGCSGEPERKKVRRLTVAVGRWSVVQWRTFSPAGTGGGLSSRPVVFFGRAGSESSKTRPRSSLAPPFQHSLPHAILPQSSHSTLTTTTGLDPSPASGSHTIRQERHHHQPCPILHLNSRPSLPAVLLASSWLPPRRAFSHLPFSHITQLSSHV